MPKCTNCDLELKNPVKSVVVPDTENTHYVACINCGKVMLAEYEGEDISKIEAIPAVMSKESVKHMQTAYKLFCDSGAKLEKAYVDREKTIPVDINKLENFNCEVSNSNTDINRGFFSRLKSLLQKIKAVFA